MANNNNPATCAIPATLLLLLLLLFSLFSSPSVTTMAQPQTPGATITTTPTTTIPTSPPLTPEEQEEQIRLQNVIAATTRNLEQGEKEVNGIVFTPRWSNPVWVEADSLSILFAYCLPGEFADSGQEILGGSQLEVLESYALALTGDLMVWFAVVENEDEQNRLPAAVGVICASDLNDAQTRVLSPQEQQEINNIIQQFITIQNTQVTNIENVINIINNVTTNATTGGPVMPPPPTNDTGGGGGTTPPGGGGGGLPGPQVPGGIPENATAEAEIEPPIVEIVPSHTQGIAPLTVKFDAVVNEESRPHSWVWDWGQRPGIVDDGRITGNCYLDDPTKDCRQGLHVEHTFMQAGTYVVVLTLEADGGSTSDSIVITVEPRGPPGGTTVEPTEQLEGVPPPPTVPEEEGGGDTTVEEEQQQPPPTDEGTAPPPVEEQPAAATEEEEAATSPPPANDGGG